MRNRKENNKNNTQHQQDQILLFTTHTSHPHGLIRLWNICWCASVATVHRFWFRASDFFLVSSVLVVWFWNPPSPIAKVYGECFIMDYLVVLEPLPKSYQMLEQHLGALAKWKFERPSLLPILLVSPAQS